MKNFTISILLLLICVGSCKQITENKSGNLSGNESVDSGTTANFSDLKIVEKTLADDAFGEIVELKGVQITTNQIF